MGKKKKKKKENWWYCIYFFKLNTDFTKILLVSYIPGNQTPKAKAKSNKNKQKTWHDQVSLKAWGSDKNINIKKIWLSKITLTLNRLKNVINNGKLERWASFNIGNISTFLLASKCFDLPFSWGAFRTLSNI